MGDIEEGAFEDMVKGHVRVIKLFYITLHSGVNIERSGIYNTL